MASNWGTSSKFWQKITSKSVIWWNLARCRLTKHLRKSSAFCKVTLGFAWLPLKRDLCGPKIQYITDRPFQTHKLYFLTFCVWNPNISIYFVKRGKTYASSKIIESKGTNQLGKIPSSPASPASPAALRLWVSLTLQLPAQPPSRCLLSSPGRVDLLPGEMSRQR